MTPLFRKFLGIHWILFVAMVAMLVGGIWSIYAAVHFRPEDAMNQQWNTQIRWALLGLCVFFVAALLDYRWIRWASLPIYFFSLGLLVLQSVKGETVHGQTLSLKLGPLSIQASQVAIGATILLLAFVLGEGHRYVPWLRHYLVRLVVAGIIFAVPFLLVLKQHDLGSAMVMVPILAAMLVVGNIPFRCLIAVTLVGLIVLPWIYFFKLESYQQERIKVTMDLLMNKQMSRERLQGDAWTQTNLLIGIGSGGWEGKGLDPVKREQNQVSILHLGMASKATAHTDYIFGSACETFGFRGGSAMILGYIFILTMCLMIAFFSRDPAGRLMIVGIVALLFAHIFEHIGMNIGLLPVTGIPLPLVSYGGTFLILNLGLFGMVQSVWVHRNAMVEEAAAKSRRQPTNRPRPAPSFA